MKKLKLMFLLVLRIFGVLQVNATADANRNISRDLRIINGTAAKLDSARHQVSIRHSQFEEKEFGSGHSCGGSLISSNVVLTAAHCLLNPSFKYYPDEEFVLVMGNLNRYENNNNTLRFGISRTIKGSLNFNLDGDIALIILNGTVPANHPTAQPITLNSGHLENNTLCCATGWGMTEEGELSSFLRAVDLPLIDVNDCRNKTEYESRIREGMLCAGYLEGGRDACAADSGGPLVCNGVQAGIVSWGNDCAKPLNPGVYTDVAYHRNWILQQLTIYNASLPKFAPVPDGTAKLTFCLFLLRLTSIVNLIC